MNHRLNAVMVLILSLGSIVSICLTVLLTSSALIPLNTSIQIDIIDQPKQWLIGTSVVGAALLASLQCLKKIQGMKWTKRIFNIIASLCSLAILGTSLYSTIGPGQRSPAVMLDFNTRLDSVVTVGKETHYELSLVREGVNTIDIDRFSAAMLIRAHGILCADENIIPTLMNGHIVVLSYRDMYGRFVSTIEVDRWSCMEAFRINGKKWRGPVI